MPELRPIDDDLLRDFLGNLANGTTAYAELPTFALRSIVAELLDARSQIGELRGLVGDLVDPEPCSDFDHHGYCQTHGWLTDGRCPHARAADLGLVDWSDPHDGMTNDDVDPRPADWFRDVDSDTEHQGDADA